MEEGETIYIRDLIVCLNQSLKVMFFFFSNACMAQNRLPDILDWMEQKFCRMVTKWQK
jgi:hypothetical protein